MLKPKTEAHSLEISREMGTCIYLLWTEVEYKSLKGCYVLAFFVALFCDQSVNEIKREDELQSLPKKQQQKKKKTKQPTQKCILRFWNQWNQPNSSEEKKRS